MQGVTEKDDLDGEGYPGAWQCALHSRDGVSDAAIQLGVGNIDF
jgi:hypothetical protein